MTLTENPSMPETLYVTHEEDGGDGGWFNAHSNTDDIACGMRPGDTQVVAEYRLVGKRVLGIVASLTPVE